MNGKLIPKGISQYMLLIQNNYFEIATSKVDILLKFGPKMTQNSKGNSFWTILGIA